jgi:hypothetical protein
MTKTRMILITRIDHYEEVENKKTGKKELKPVHKKFPCKVNAGVPFNHRMANEIF